jgi:hypothetical protein
MVGAAGHGTPTVAHTGPMQVTIAGRVGAWHRCPPAMTYRTPLPHPRHITISVGPKKMSLQYTYAATGTGNRREDPFKQNAAGLVHGRHASRCPHTLRVHPQLGLHIHQMAQGGGCLGAAPTQAARRPAAQTGRALARELGASHCRRCVLSESLHSRGRRCCWCCYGGGGRHCSCVCHDLQRRIHTKREGTCGSAAQAGGVAAGPASVADGTGTVDVVGHHGGKRERGTIAGGVDGPRARAAHKPCQGAIL